MLRVVAAVIARNGRVLIGQRRAGGSHAFEWEFPGGKVEGGESLRTALARELQEELGIEAEIGREITRYVHPARTPLELIFFEVCRFAGEPVNRAFADIRWVLTSELLQYPFLDGDRRVIRTLTAAHDAASS
jgi:8-oxo-dGTP diphosphatase